MTDKSGKQEKIRYNFLSQFEEFVIEDKGTEEPWTGKYNYNKKEGTYICKKCGQALFRSHDKFDSQCGWPSFDDEITGAIKRLPDADGVRTEILCSNCDAHLGHVFRGEGYTEKDTRHCVNSVSVDFIPEKLESGIYEKALLAGGCFWGVDYYLKELKGVVTVISGYTGGHVKNPSYREVCNGTTGHAEAVKVVYDPLRISYKQVVKNFLEIHDPTQLNRQGPDTGSQYRSEIFYMNNHQKEIAENLLNILREKGYNVVTKLTKASEFFEAEDYHQDYYFKKGSTPYCHSYIKRF